MTALDSVNSHSVCNSVWSDVEIVWKGQLTIDQFICFIQIVLFSLHPPSSVKLYFV